MINSGSIMPVVIIVSSIEVRRYRSMRHDEMKEKEEK